MQQASSIAPVMIDIDGCVLSQSDIDRISSPLVGGLILFTRNFESTDQLKRLVASIRAVKPNLIIAVDHEGGRVQRFRSGFSRIPPMKALGDLAQQSASGLERALVFSKELGWLMASELRAFDIDISFAPVLDRDHGISEIIGDRAFSDKPELITALAGAFIQGMHDAGMASTGKHFPGHGAIEADSHIAIPVDERSYDDIANQDMLVFEALSNNGMDAVMPAHVIYPEVCASPAGFSSKWLQTILRKQLAFDGVIFSDDLSMEGATVAGSFSQRASAALQAGCDMVLVCNNTDAADEVIASLAGYEQPERSAKRLARMLGKGPAADIVELQNTQRWKDAQVILGKLTN